MAKIEKVLVANRGEIAIRIFRTCRKMNIKSIAIYTDVDRKAPHVRYADEAYPISSDSQDISYLQDDKIIMLAKEKNAAIHPGYGFFAENADFAEKCKKNNVIFIGPASKHIKLMGSKTGARDAMTSAGVPVVPGTKNPIRDLNDAKNAALEIGYPIMLKAVYGGGGKGMRILKDEQNFDAAFRTASSEALSSFGNGDIYIEKYIVKPHHVEIQVLGDQHGRAIHLFERECSIQRRHQKVIEETPSPFIDDKVRNNMYEVAVKAVKSLGYYSAGTLEFIVGSDQTFYFLEMNTRLQVEHPITEITTGIDIVREMIRVAEGKELTFKQNEISRHGHAIECRIYAEDPTNNFAPSPGLVTVYQAPEGPNVRVSSGAYDGYEIPIYYDPLIAKVCANSKTREGAIENMKRILSEYIIAGIRTNISFHQSVLKNKTFVSGIYDTDFIDTNFNMEDLQRKKNEDVTISLIAAAIRQVRSERISLQKTDTDSKPIESNWKKSGKVINVSNKCY